MMLSPFSTRCMTPDDWTRLRFFKAAEFSQPERMGYEFMRWLEQVRGFANVPMRITSSYRTPEHNVTVGGAEDSAHCDTPCNAVDIGMDPRPDDPNWNESRYEIVRAAMTLGCMRIGTYNDGSLHIDRTEYKRPAPRMWRQVDNPAH